MSVTFLSRQFVLWMVLLVVLAVLGRGSAGTWGAIAGGVLTIAIALLARDRARPMSRAEWAALLGSVLILGLIAVATLGGWA